MYKREPPGRNPKDYPEEELTDDDIRFIRSWAKQIGHIRWLCRTILKPAAITVIATLAGLPPLISGLKEILKWFGGSK